MNALSKTFVHAALTTLALHASASWATDVEVAAAPLLATALTESGGNNVIDKFKHYNPGYASVNFVVTANVPTGTLRYRIQGYLDSTSGYESYDYDLFLAADTDNPSYLVDNYGSDVSAMAVFSTGELMVWSEDSGMDVTSAAFPGSATGFGVCNPAMGPYGGAALNILLDEYGISTSDTRIAYYSPIGQVDANVDNGNVQTGFVPTALHCASGAVHFDATAHPDASYLVFDDTYDQGGLVVYTGDTAAETAAAALLTWLQTTQGQTELARYCLAH